MKISIAWLFDHLDSNKNDIDISTLIERFNQTTAEIEGCEKVELPLDLISCAQIITQNAQSITVQSPEWDSEYQMPNRTDANMGDWLLIFKNSTECRWVTLADVGGSKEGLMPSLYLDQKEQAGDWKHYTEKKDYILNVDNKSLTHRPDMWGHRGFAREIAAIFDLPLKPLDNFLITLPLQKESTSGSTGSIQASIEDTTCDRFACLSIPTIERKPSLLWMALRLARVDSKPIDMIVDSTNYVMLDISQPMHAFDADKLHGKKITVRKAHNKELLLLRSGETLELTSQDTILCDDTTPICLAGIIGNKTTAIDNDTHALVIISEHFNPTAIRLTASRHKIRTESSTRFEKNIDPHQNIYALQRFLKLCTMAPVSYTCSDAILSLGKEYPQIIIEIDHSFIEQRLGVSIDSAFIISTLNKLSCATETIQKNTSITYIITVPTFRATKDIMIKEDIVEEIGRFYGYGTIPLTLPRLPLAAKNIQPLIRMRAIKRILADSCAMCELYTYSFFDESFLRILSWEPEKSLSVQNPVSENWQRLVTSLIPNMIKAVAADSAEHDELRFFELARTWNPLDTDAQEKEVLSGIVFNKKHDINFYDAKQIIQKITDSIHMHTTWVPIENPQDPWFSPYQSARIMHNGQCLGIAGIIPNQFLHRVTEGHAFAFELDAAFLRSYTASIIRYKPSSKYPTIARDISMLVPLAITTDDIINLIKSSDTRITDVTLIDFFEKKEWIDKKSLTIRFILCDQEKTMQKEEIDFIGFTITTKLIQHGAVIR